MDPSRRAAPTLEYQASRTIVPAASNFLSVILCMTLLFLLVQVIVRIAADGSFRLVSSVADWLVFGLGSLFFGGMMLLMSAGPHRRRWTLDADGVSIERRNGERIAFVRWADVRRISVGWTGVSLIQSFWSRQVLIGLTAAQRQYIQSAYEVWKAAAVASKAP